MDILVLFSYSNTIALTRGCTEFPQLPERVHLFHKILIRSRNSLDRYILKFFCAMHTTVITTVLIDLDNQLSTAEKQTTTESKQQ